jgi:calcineurin-like phosphoesterase
MNILVNDASLNNKAELRVYNALGQIVMNTSITKPLTTLDSSLLPSGIYSYKITGNNKIIKSGRLIAQ